MKRIIHLSIALFLFSSTAAIAQNIATQTIRWNAVQVLDLQTGSATQDIHYVITSADEIKWYDSYGVLKQTFQITQRQGSWSNVAQPGSIFCEVTAGERRGRIEISRTSEQMLIRITLFSDAPDQATAITELTIANTTVQ